MCSNRDRDGDKNVHVLAIIAGIFLIGICLLGWGKVENYQRMVKDCEMAAQSPCEIVAVPSEDLR